MFAKPLCVDLSSFVVAFYVVLQGTEILPSQEDHVARICNLLWASLPRGFIL
jgi:hypothetical protein